MSTAIIPLSEEIERVLLTGDLGKLTVDQRLSYYNRVCESLELNPLTKPFLYLSLNGKLVLYATKDCTEQLRKKHSVSVRIVSREEAAGCYVVTAQAALPSGRCDESIGAVNIENLKGESRSNALMKAETKAKRRVTLSICGLGMLDESEVDSMPGAVPFEQGSREAQKEVADKRIKELTPQKSNVTVTDLRGQEWKEPNLTIQPSTIIELADSLDAPPEPTYEQRESAKQQEAAAALKPVGTPKETRKKGSIAFKDLANFGTMKDELSKIVGDNHEYYDILKLSGVSHADALNADQVKPTYKLMAERYKQLRKEKEDKDLLMQAQKEALRIGPKFTKEILERRGLECVDDILNLGGTELDDLLRELKTTA